MKREVYKNIYQFEIPLPNNPLKSLNTYIITSNDRNLIIDSGFNMPECEEAMMNAINELGLDVQKTDLLITHAHADHSGLGLTLQEKGMKLYSSPIDGKLINEMISDEYWQKFDDYEIMFDLKRDNIGFHNHPAYKYCSRARLDFIFLKEGNIFNIGEFSFKVIDIPGHTPGHIGLYDENHKIFFCGDHILGKITPNITFWGFNVDYLSVYFDSLKKVYEYDIDYLFSAHRFLVKDHRQRINELLSHHQNRLNEIIDIIKYKKMSVRDTASKMTWDLSCKVWDDFPAPQKWFASGEAISHLEHLFTIGKAEKSMKNGILYYKGV